MFKTRMIPVLLLKDKGLVKTRKFRNPVYLGDPINITRIFNDKEVDELVLLDIGATVEGKRPDFELLAKIAAECFMPLAYGGGLKTVEDLKTVFRIGFEKVIINTGAVENPGFIAEAAGLFGSQSVVVSMDVKKGLFSDYLVFSHSGRKKTNLDPVEHALAMEKQGAGEIILNSINRDGTMQGYDLTLIKMVAEAVNVPVVACGGAGSKDDLREAVVTAGASAVAAGSLFVFHGPHRAVLINVPTYRDQRKLLSL